MRKIFDEFVHSEVTGSILLLIAAIVALLWANSQWAAWYFELLHSQIGIVIGPQQLILPLDDFINEGLMVIFFLVVGLEIKRELLVGELCSPGKAILPITAALGGMIFPALIYLAFNAGKPGVNGWAIPMATDIAFALGVLALLGSRVPPSLKVFLTALAIADDLGAVVVIAVFYSEKIQLIGLIIALILLICLVAANRFRVHRPEIYILLGVGVWLAVLASGIHATVAGVLVALTIPVRTRVNPSELIETGRANLTELEQAELTPDSMIHDRAQMEAINGLYDAAGELRPAGLVLENYFHPLLVWIILPMFALFNAGIQLNERVIRALETPVTLGVFFGLVIGKQIGVTVFSWLAVKSGRAILGEGITWKHIYSVSWLCGMGFTMSLFISDLAFTDEELINLSKVGILLASLVAGVVGYVLLNRWLPAKVAQKVNASGDL